MTTGPRVAVAQLPPAPGVYRFRDERGRPLYVGRASDLRRRVGSYWTGLGDRRRLRPMVASIVSLEAAVCDSCHEAAWLERNLLERELPPWNRTRGGEEAPAYLRLDGRPGSPRLKVVHEPTPAPGVSHFGPYLGGLKVRRAASALNRVLPLSYAGVGPTGSERDMARVRGVAAGDRGLLVRSLKAVLHRKPVAVRSLRGELMRRRDRAASSLAFELAARLQSEIEAFDWVVSEQKATVPGSHDLDVHGWADGVLVGFEVRDGRLSAWSQGACTEAEARAHVAATPARWMGFARRNAELAARLTWSGHRS